MEDKTEGRTLEEKIEERERSKLLTEIKSNGVNPENILTSTHQLETAMLQLAANAQRVGETPQSMAQLIRDFSNALYSCLNSVNKEPEEAVEAMNTVIAAVGAEPSSQAREDARKVATKILK